MTCPVCGQPQPTGQQKCETCGGWLDPKMNDPLLGREVGHFRLDSLIGRGGMGAIYLATHKVLGTSYAVKLLHPQLASDPTILERFRREAIAASQLKHSNIVFIADFGWTDGIGAYIVMEYLEGRSLGDALREGTQFTPPELIDLFQQICRGLHSAHKHKIVHRDLKPDNIFLSRVEDEDRPLVKLLDFGIARITEEGNFQPVTLSEVAIGTPHYMSPEQARAQWDLVDQRTDLYALGVILFKILTGTTPFAKGATHEVISAKARGEMTMLHEFRPELKGTELERVVHKCMAFEPTDRYPNTKALMQDLEQAIQALQAPVNLAQAETQPPERSTRVLTPGSSAAGLPTGDPISKGQVRVKQPTDPPSSPSFAPISDPSIAAIARRRKRPDSAHPSESNHPLEPTDKAGPNLAFVGGIALMVCLLLGGGFWFWTSASKGDAAKNPSKQPGGALPPLRPPPGRLPVLHPLRRSPGIIPALPPKTRKAVQATPDAGAPDRRVPEANKQPTMLELRITSYPKAKVTVPGQPSCTTPCIIKRKPGNTVVIKLYRRGYKTKKYKWRPTLNSKVHIRLKRKRRRRRVPRRRDPFGTVPI